MVPNLGIKLTDGFWDEGPKSLTFPFSPFAKNRSGHCTRGPKWEAISGHMRGSDNPSLLDKESISSY